MVSRVESALHYEAEVRNEFEIGQDSHGAPVSEWVNAIAERDGIEFSSFGGGFSDGGLGGVLSRRAEELVPKCEGREEGSSLCRMQTSIEVGSHIDEVTLVLHCPRMVFDKRKEASADEAICKAHHRAARERLVAEVGERTYDYHEARRTAEETARRLAKAKRDL